MIDTSNNTITTTNALLYKIENGIAKFLLAQETDGLWGLPGGAKEVEDPDLLTAIERELKEELGLEPSDYDLKESGVKREFEYNHFQSSRYGKHGIVVFFLVHINEISKLKVSSELSQVEWFTKEEALEKLSFDHIKEGFEEASRLI
jgi:8-oxo-dGTP pyrophosphatase MutT (NUDIX family)